MSGDTVVVGAAYDDSYKGSAYVFEKGGGWATGTETAKLTASDGAGDDYFGWSVSVSGDTVVVGAYYDDSAKGSAYVFVEPGGGWATGTETAKLTASDGAANDFFGISVSVSGDTVVVGAYNDDSAKGSAYVFVEPGGGWATGTETAKLTASDGAAYDYFGYSVSVSGDTVVVGAYNDDSAKGSAYVFEDCIRSAQTGSWGSTTTWDSGAVPTSADGVCVLNGHTVTLGANGQSRFVYVESGGTLDLSTYSLTTEETVRNYGTMQQTKDVGASSTVNFLQIRDSGDTTDQYRGLDITTGAGVNLGSTAVRIMGNTSVCNNNDGGSYRDRCFMANPANSGTASVTLHSTAAEDDLSDDAFFQYASGTTWTEMTACNDAVGGGATCTESSVTFSSPEYFLIGSQGGDPTAITQRGFSARSVGQDAILSYMLAALVAVGIGGLGLVWRRRRRAMESTTNKERYQ